MGIKGKEINWDNRIYAATVSELLSVLKEYKKSPKTIMLVGHNPGLEDLMVYLVGDGLHIPLDGKLLPTAAVAHLKMPNDWKDLAEGAAQLVSVKRVKDVSLD